MRARAIGEKMLQNLSISTKLAAGIAALCVFGLLSGIVGIVMLLTIEDGVDEITDYAGPVVETTDGLIYAVSESHKVAVEILADEDMESIALREIEFASLLEEFDTNYEALDLLLVDTDLQLLLDNAAATRINMLGAVDAMLQAHKQELSDRAEAQTLVNQFDRIGDFVLAELALLASNNAAEIQNAENNGDRLISNDVPTAQRVNDLLVSLFEHDYPAVEASQNLQITVEQLKGATTRYLSIDALDELPPIREEFVTLVASADAYFSRLMDVAETADDAAVIEYIKSIFDSWVAQAQEAKQVFDTHNDMLLAKRDAALAAERVNGFADQLVSDLNMIADQGDAISAGTYAQASALVQTAQFSVGGLAVAILLFSIALFVALRQTIMRPLATIIEALNMLAKGDMDIEIVHDSRKDEIGQLNRALGVFHGQAIEKNRLAEEQDVSKAEAERKATTLQTLFGSFEAAVGSVVDTVSNASQSLQTSARTMTEVAEQTSERSSIVASASEDASTNVQSVASAAEEISASVSEIGRQASESSAKAGAAEREAESTMEKVRKLSDAARRIGDVVTLIEDIAEQTNLLALNATIEAARAGESGRGFAVVAGEVKELASQTAKATADIAAQITEIQDATETSATAIADISTTIQELSAISASIATAVEQQASATQEIATNVHRAASGTQEVSDNIATVSNSAQESQTSANSVLGSAAELTEQADKLKREVSTFVESVRAAA